MGKCNRSEIEILTVVKMSMLVFWVVTPCGLTGRYVSEEKWYLPMRLYGVTT
jgi:hypothetical protein